MGGPRQRQDSPRVALEDIDGGHCTLEVPHLNRGVLIVHDSDHQFGGLLHIGAPRQTGDGTLGGEVGNGLFRLQIPNHHQTRGRGGRQNVLVSQQEQHRAGEDGSEQAQQPKVQVKEDGHHTNRRQAQMGVLEGGKKVTKMITAAGYLLKLAVPRQAGNLLRRLRVGGSRGKRFGVFWILNAPNESLHRVWRDTRCHTTP